MSSIPVIPGFDILKNFQTHFFPGFKLSTINQLCFEGLKKAFSHGIIPTVPLTAHTLSYTVKLKDIDSLIARILNTPVRMKNHALGKLPVFTRHHNSRNDSFGSTHAIANGPTYRFTIKKVENHRQVNEPINNRDICQVGNAGYSRLISMKVTIQQIRSHLVVVRGVCGHFKAFGKFAAQTHLLHVPGHRVLRNHRRRFGHLQIFCQPGASIAAFGSKICITNLFVKFLPFPGSLAFRIMEPVIIRTAGNFQNPAHHLDRPSFRLVILNELVYQRSLLEMMPKAFFNISRSISVSRSLFFRSANSLASSLRACTPWPGKLRGPFSWNSFRHRYNNRGSTPNSCASSVTFLRSKLNLTAFSLNDLS